MSTRPKPPLRVEASAFKEVAPRSLARDAAEQLRRVIVGGNLEPGDKLPSERDLAARLGVSRPTLREAVRALVIMGLLESRQGAGTFVARGAREAGTAATITIEMGDDPLASLFEIRLLLEPVGASRAASMISAGELADLGRLLDAMAAQTERTEDFVRMDAEFHRIIHVAAHSPMILAMLDGISELAMRGRILSGRIRGTTERTVGEHRIVLEALERGDPFESAAAMTSHLMHIRSTLIGQTT